MLKAYIITFFLETRWFAPVCKAVYLWLIIICWLENISSVNDFRLFLKLCAASVSSWWDL